MKLGKCEKIKSIPLPSFGCSLIILVTELGGGIYLVSLWSLLEQISGNIQVL